MMIRNPRDTSITLSVSERRHGGPQAFTLVELLVVITIIVILIALLMPAMDKAIYEAELAVCGANLDATVVGIVQYAFDQKRFFPDRKAIYLNTAGDLPRTLQIVFRGQTYDDRAPLIGYVRWDQLVDPLIGQLDVSPEGSDTDSIIYSDYDLWWDWQFTNADGGGKGSTRLGSNWHWDGHAYDTIVSDMDLGVTVGNDMSQSSHPDKTNTMVLQVLQDKGLNHFEGKEAAAGPAGGKVTWSQWYFSTPYRGPIDKLFGKQDGSVQRYNDIPPIVAGDIGYPGDSAYPGMNRVPDLRNKWRAILNDGFKHVPR